MKELAVLRAVMKQTYISERRVAHAKHKRRYKRAKKNLSNAQEDAIIDLTSLSSSEDSDFEVMAPVKNFSYWSLLLFCSCSNGWFQKSDKISGLNKSKMLCTHRPSPSSGNSTGVLTSKSEGISVSFILAVHICQNILLCQRIFTLSQTRYGIGLVYDGKDWIVVAGNN